jgi:hypothetical protein
MKAMSSIFCPPPGRSSLCVFTIITQHNPIPLHCCFADKGLTALPKKYSVYSYPEPEYLSIVAY